MQSESAIDVQPLRNFLDGASRYISQAPRQVYDKPKQEWTYVVNPNGDLWGISEIEDNRYLYGNILQAPLPDILASEPRHSTFACASRQVDRICSQCPYLGYCPGYFVADATEGVLAILETEGCHIRAVMDHVVMRLRKSGLADAIRRRMTDRNSLPAFEVSGGGAKQQVQPV